VIRSDAPTLRAKRSPIILVVGFSDDFVRRCGEAAARHQTTVAGVAEGAESTFIMQAVPNAVVMRESAAVGSALAKIAPDLGIELVTLADEDVSDAALDDLIAKAIALTHVRQRGNPHAG
jgi:hypothetical protein